MKRVIDKRLDAAGLAVAALLLGGCAVSNGPGAPPQVARTCTELNGMAIPATAIGLPTTGAMVTSAVLVPAAGAGVAAVADYCKVLGDVNPVDVNAPKIKFQVNLPANWNTKAVMFGGGGYNGVIATGIGNVPAGPADKPAPLARGYATFGSDSGHQANATGSRDGAFGANDEALKNFSADAIKKNPRRGDFHHPVALCREREENLFCRRLDRRARGADRRAELAARL